MDLTASDRNQWLFEMERSERTSALRDGGIMPTFVWRRCVIPSHILAQLMAGIQYNKTRIQEKPRYLTF
jgi:hypothetical protein